MLESFKSYFKTLIENMIVCSKIGNVSDKYPLTITPTNTPIPFNNWTPRKVVS